MPAQAMMPWSLVLVYPMRFLVRVAVPIRPTMPDRERELYNERMKDEYAVLVMKESHLRLSNKSHSPT